MAPVAVLLFVICSAFPATAEPLRVVCAVLVLPALSRKFVAAA